MPYMAKDVAFGSIGFQPGFPSLSQFSCNPWSTSATSGACPTAPVALARERAALPATDVVRRAMLEVGAGPFDYNYAMAQGIVPASLAGISDDNLPMVGGLAGDCGCGCGGSCGLGDYGVPDFNAVMADPLAFLKSNLFPMALGAALLMLVKRR